MRTREWGFSSGSAELKCRGQVKMVETKKDVSLY